MVYLCEGKNELNNKMTTFLVQVNNKNNIKKVINVHPEILIKDIITIFRELKDVSINNSLSCIVLKESTIEKDTD